MLKPDLVDTLAARVDISKEKATDAINIVLDSITDAVAQENTVNLIGFGSFSMRKRPERMGKNPKTGESITIAASKTVVFKPGKALKQAVNQ